MEISVLSGVEISVLSGVEISVLLGVEISVLSGVDVSVLSGVDVSVLSGLLISGGRQIPTSPPKIVNTPIPTSAMSPLVTIPPKDCIHEDRSFPRPISPIEIGSSGPHSSISLVATMMDKRFPHEGLCDSFGETETGEGIAKTK